MTTEGLPGVEIITSSDSVDVQPEELVTVKVYRPPNSSVIVLLVPVPDVVTSPGNLVITHAPVDGKPLSTTLPNGTA